MPEIDGYSLLKELQRTLPQVPVIIVTGEYKLQKLFEVERVHAFITKPFDLGHLENKISEVLAAE